MKLIVGLGNPGRTHANNRHNVGFMCLNHFARSQAIPFDRKQGHARIGIGEVASEKVAVAKPQTYMNLSGRSVGLLTRRFNIDHADLIVIHDDLDLPLGTIRINYGAGSGGHKGVDSIITELESQAFVRLRIGIGRPSPTEGNDRADIMDYVLTDFTPEERQIIARVIPRVNDATLCLLTEGLKAAMDKYNRPEHDGQPPNPPG